MLKLLIADDEPKIRRNLKEAVDWEELGIEVAGEAEDGETALAMSREMRPDILLVDICMPFLNGLDFIREVQKTLTESKIIIITVYDDFTYAQQAVKLRIFDYILKPIDRDQLREVIEKAKRELESSRSLQKRLLRTDLQLQKNFEPMKQKFLSEFLNGRFTEPEAEEQAGFFGLPLDSRYGIMVMKVLETRIGGAEEPWERPLLLYAAQNIARDMLSHFQPSEVFLDGKENLVALAPVGDGMHWAAADEEIGAMIGRAVHHAAVSVSRVLEDGLSALPAAYPELLNELEEKCGCTPIVLLIQKYLEAHFADPDLSLQQAAEKMRISPSYLSKVLKRDIGLSFIDFLTQLRIKKATQLMNDPSEKIYEIAEKVGYSDQHYFSTAFKKVLGISPVEYRRRGKTI